MPDDHAPPLPLDEVVARVQRHQPAVAGRVRSWRAATALVLYGHEDPEILFIERARRAGDRWSGQMALPGGRADESDADLAATATRETFEEVGVTLAEPVGRLDDVSGRVASNAVATYVFALDQRPAVQPEPSEVETAVWIPWSHLSSPRAADRYRYGGVGLFPAVTYQRFTIWGLTYRILENFAATLGRPLPQA